MTQEQGCDVLIIGAGIMGCALAYELARDGADVVLVDRGAVCAGSSALNAGGVRHQFTGELNARMAARSIDRIVRLQQEWGIDVAFRQVGYLILAATDEHDSAFRETVRRQNGWSIPSRYIDTDQITELVPGIRTDDLQGASFCPTDGYLDPHALVSGFARAARELGARITTNAQVVGIDTAGDRVTRVITARGERYTPGIVVNAAGVWSPAIARLHGGDLPITPWPAQIFLVVRTPDFGDHLPMTIDFEHGKLYFHREGPGLAVGMAYDTPSPLMWDLPCDWTQLPLMAERLAHRIPALETAEVTRGWAGFLEVTADENPLVGWMGPDNMYVAAGFSGHGLSIAPGLAPEVAREIRRLQPTIPLNAYRPARFAAEAVDASWAEGLSMSRVEEAAQ